MYKVLLVDDEEMVTEGLSRFVKWEKAGFVVAGTATSVARALLFLENNPVDLVITDVQMPVQNGIDLIRILKNEYPHIKSIILSGYSDFLYAQQAIRLGALDYLTKPINFGAMMELLEKIRQILENQQRKQLNYDQLQSLLANNLILNFATGYPFDEKRAATCLNLDCAITVGRITAQGNTELPKCIITTLHHQFAPCRVLHYGAQELLVVFEHSITEHQLSTFLGECSNGLSLCMGIAEADDGYKELRRATLQAGKAMRYQKARGVSGVLNFARISNIFLYSGKEQDTLANELIEILSLPQKRPTLLPTFTKELFALAENSEFSLAEAQRYCVELLIELDTPIQNFALTDYQAHDALSNALIDIFSSKTLEELIDCVRQYLQNILDRLALVDEAAYAGELADRVKFYIQEHFAEELSLGVLAEVFFASPVYISRLFKKKNGVNFVDYLTTLRIEKAKEYLCDSELKIYNIAEMVGYENPRYFGKLFKEAVGCTPQEYRQSLGSQTIK